MAKRRGNGEGHIIKNKNGTYTSKFMLGYKDNGKKIYSASHVPLKQKFWRKCAE